MKESILKNKMILAVDDDPDVLTVLEEEILTACPDCHFHKVTHYNEAIEKMVSLTYDILLLDIINVRGIKLLELAQSRQIPVGLLTTYPLIPETLRQSTQVAAHGYLPKEKLGEIVPFLEEMMARQNLPGWSRLFKEITRFVVRKVDVDWRKKVYIAPAEMGQPQPL
jgi:CheY-like chemotaxis protein